MRVRVCVNKVKTTLDELVLTKLCINFVFCCFIAILLFICTLHYMIQTILREHTQRILNNNTNHNKIFLETQRIIIMTQTNLLIKIIHNHHHNMSQNKIDLYSVPFLVAKIATLKKDWRGFGKYLHGLYPKLVTSSLLMLQLVSEFCSSFGLSWQKQKGCKINHHHVKNRYTTSELEHLAPDQELVYLVYKAFKKGNSTTICFRKVYLL